ncbi:MAG TPA: hypothetical protein VFE01_06090 [Terracidiphilus sp.]|nr:hypothetical protein [Terracidiphilus sp.]
MPNDPNSSDRPGIGLMDLYAIGADAFKQLGGGEEYLRREREALQFPAEEHSRAGKQDEA